MKIDNYHITNNQKDMICLLREVNIFAIIELFGINEGLLNELSISQNLENILKEKVAEGLFKSME